MTNTSKDTDGVITEISDLTIEVSHREDVLILQQNSGSGGFEVDRIAIHATQVRLIAEHMGLLSMPEPTVPQLQRTIATLSRRLRKLHERIDHLGHYLHHHSDSERANLEYEQTYALATCEIADEFTADLDESTGQPVGPASDLEPGLAPGVLWEGSNGGRQIDPGSTVGAVKETQRKRGGSPAAAQLSFAVGGEA